jgi:hypothetical protein
MNAVVGGQAAIVAPKMRKSSIAALWWCLREIKRSLKAKGSYVYTL